MTDTHSHIYSTEFVEDVDEVVLRAQQVGIEKIFLPNINEESIQPMLNLCQRYPRYLYPMMGLHPEDVRTDWQEVLQRMETYLQAEKHPYIAVGEVGLDFYWDKTYRREQLLAFESQIQWATRYDLPLVIHCREAHNDLIALLANYRNEPLRGVFHCFAGTLAQAEELLSFPHFAIGIGGILTFKNSALPEVVTQIPLKKIVVETDAPYMAPTPYRGKRNESAYCVEVFEKLADVYGITVQEVTAQTNQNVRQIFGSLSA